MDTLAMNHALAKFRGQRLLKIIVEVRVKAKAKKIPIKTDQMNKSRIVYCNKLST